MLEIDILPETFVKTTRDITVSQKQPPEVFYKKAIFKKLAIFTGKHLYWSHLKPTTLIKRGSSTDVFHKYCLSFENIYFEEHLPMTAFDQILILWILS